MRPDSGAYWGGFAASLFTLAGLLFVLGLALKGAKQGVFSERWVDAGVVVGVGGVLALARSAVIYIRSGHPVEEGTPSPLEAWIQTKLDGAATIARDRHVQGDDWYFEKMGEWELALINEMALDKDPVAPGLVDDYRRHPLTGLIDGIPPPHGTQERDGYYQRRLDWLSRKVRELGTGLIEPEPAVSDQHREQLQSIAEGVERYIHLERKVRYHPPGQDGLMPVALSFRAHFAGVVRMLDQWDELMPQLDTARQALEDWIEARAEAQCITYYGPLPNVLRNLIEHNGTLSWRHEESFLWLGGHAILQAGQGADLPALEKPVEDLLISAALSDPCNALLDLVLLVEDARGQILTSLQDIRAKHVIRGRCELCG
jgi:hypothetical protein